MVIFTANDEALDSKSLIRVTSKSKNFNCVNIHEKGEREKKKKLKKIRAQLYSSWSVAYNHPWPERSVRNTFM